MNLTDFLLARVAEDEAIARSAIGRTKINDFGEVLNFDMWHEQDWIMIGDQQLAHVTRHDPARVLAECEAKRRIVEQCAPLVTPERLSWADADRDPSPDLADQILRTLALPYAGHPDYRTEWRMS